MNMNTNTSINMTTIIMNMNVNTQVQIGGADKDAILKQVKSKNYQLACQRHFEATHKGHETSGVSTDGVGNHPNAWMHASMEFHREKVRVGARPSALLLLLVVAVLVVLLCFCRQRDK